MSDTTKTTPRKPCLICGEEAREGVLNLYCPKCFGKMLRVKQLKREQNHRDRRPRGTSEPATQKD